MSVFKNITITSIIFLMPPSIVYYLNWQWSPDSLNQFSRCFFLITETAGSPWSIVTSIVFFMLFCLALKIRTIPHAMVMAAILTLTLCLGQAIKLIIKNYSQQPRPYVVWLQKNNETKERAFYPKNSDDYHRINMQHHGDTIPKWLMRYWQEDASYSFPSGHTLFSASWTLLAVILIGYARSYLLLITMTIWGLLVEVSRLLLAMHYPSDILFSVLIAYILSLIVYFCTKRWRIVKYLSS